MARILVATQSASYPDWLVNVAERLGGWQGINPWRGEWQKFTERGLFALGRYVANDDADKFLVKQGAAGAEIWFRDWFWPMASRCLGIKVWCGHNEEPAKSAEDARAQDAFVSRQADLYHDHGLELAGYRVSTHHWAFDLWQYFAESLSKVDYLARNSYELGARFDLDDTNGLMRLARDVETIRGYGLRVPPCILTELGYDSNASSQLGHRGWRTRGIDAETYTTELVQATLRIASLVPELRYVSPFISQVEDPAWSSFELDQGNLEMLADKMTPSYTVPDPTPAPATPLEERIRNAAWRLRNIPYNPDAAFALYAREHDLGAPLTTEDYGQVDGYALQAFVGGIVYARVGDWGNVRQIDW